MTTGMFPLLVAAIPCEAVASALGRINSRVKRGDPPRVPDLHETALRPKDLDGEEVGA